MKCPLFTLACFLVAACGSTDDSRMDADMPASQEAGATTGPLLSIHQVREIDGDRKVGTVYERDHGNGRRIFWVYDTEGRRRGFVTPDNRGYAYDYTLGRRGDTARFIGADTLSTLSRRVLGHDRAVKLVEIDIETWARAGR